MQNIPEWAWKLLSAVVLPLGGWAIGTHTTVADLSTETEQIAMDVDEVEEKVEKIESVQRDVAIIQTQIEYLVKSVDEIKEAVK